MRRKILRVLLVDDEDEMVTALAERLSLRGIEADWVTSGEDALARVSDKKYDVLVLDVKMPGMGGLAAGNESHISYRPWVGLGF
jgi:DNA-binding response OmpR family regulator